MPEQFYDDYQMIVREIKDNEGWGLPEQFRDKNDDRDFSE